MENILNVVFTIVKRKLESKNLSIDNDEISDYVEEVLQVICNYCHIKEVPFALRFTAANMSVDYILSFSQEAAQEIEGDDAMVAGTSGEVASISEGGTSISFKTKQGGGAGGSILTPEERTAALVLSYEPQLKVFRRIVY